MSLYLGNTPIAVNSSSRNIGEIIQSTIPLTDAGLHLLDGGVISGSGSYSAFVTYISGLVSDYPDLFETEANWQTAVTTYGVCGKFVYDDVNNTVRLPKITGFTEGTIDPTVLGDLVEAGLPNITGELFSSNATGQWGLISNDGANYFNTQGGVFQTDGNGTYTQSVTRGTVENSGRLTFDASRSSSIYGNSDTVQPQAIKVLYYIVIATSTKTNIEVDIDEVMTDLNGKADTDLSNVNNTSNVAALNLNSKGIRTVVETYANGASWYRVYSDGWCEQGGYSYPATSTITFLKNFSDTNYNVLTQPCDKGATTGGATYMSIFNFSVSGFSAIANVYITGYEWRADGYIS